MEIWKQWIISTRDLPQVYAPLSSNIKFQQVSMLFCFPSFRVNVLLRKPALLPLSLSLSVLARAESRARQRESAQAALSADQAERERLCRGREQQARLADSTRIHREIRRGLNSDGGVHPHTITSEYDVMGTAGELGI